MMERAITWHHQLASVLQATAQFTRSFTCCTAHSHHPKPHLLYCSSTVSIMMERAINSSLLQAASIFSE
jgi:hypothetical protein